jgi:hypothetical protein
LTSGLATHTNRKAKPTCPNGQADRALTEEKIICIGTKATDPEDFQQIEELAMNIPNNSHRRLDMNHIALFHEQLLRLGTDSLDHRLSQELLAVYSFDALIQVDTG